jgi:hypothetical protein
MRRGFFYLPSLQANGSAQSTATDERNGARVGMTGSAGVFR